MAAGDARAPSIGEAPPPRGEAERTDAAFSRFSARVEALFEAEREQLPLWLPVGLLAGIAAWFCLPDPRRLDGLPPARRRRRAGLRSRRRRDPLGAGARHLQPRRRARLRPDLVERGAGRRAPHRARTPARRSARTVESVQTLAAEGCGAPRRPRRWARACRLRLRVNVDRDKVPAGLEPGRGRQPARLDHAARAHGRARRLRFRPGRLVPADRRHRPRARPRGQRAAGQPELLAPGSPAGASASPPISAAARRRRGRGHRRRAGHGRPVRHSGGGCRGDAPLRPRPSAFGQRPSPDRRGRRGHAADPEAARVEPDAGAALPADPGRGSRGRAGRRRLYPADRRRGADGPLLHRRLAGPARHRAWAARR